MKQLLRGSLLLTALLNFNCAVAGGAQPDHVVVLTSPNFPIAGDSELKRQGIEVVVFNLADVRHTEQIIDGQLPPDENRARDQVERIIGRYQNELMRGWQGIAQAYKWGIKQVPAIVFNKGESMLYGETHLPRAVTHWRQWKANQQP